MVEFPYTGMGYVCKHGIQEWDISTNKDGLFWVTMSKINKVFVVCNEQLLLFL